MYRNRVIFLKLINEPLKNIKLSNEPRYQRPRLLRTSVASLLFSIDSSRPKSEQNGKTPVVIASEETEMQQSNFSGLICTKCMGHKISLFL
jgi:hypothetical protein